MAITTSVKLIVYLIITLQTVSATLQQPDPAELKIRNAPSMPLLEELLLKTNAKEETAALDLTRDNPLTAIYLVIANIQAAVDNAFAVVGTAVAAIIANITPVGTLLQQSIVSPLLSLANTLAGLSIVQTVEPLYAVVLVAQTVLDIANVTLVTLDTAFLTNTTSIIISSSLVVVDSVFALILSLFV